MLRKCTYIFGHTGKQARRVVLCTYVHVNNTLGHVFNFDLSPTHPLLFLRVWLRFWARLPAPSVLPWLVVEKGALAYWEGADSKATRSSLLIATSKGERRKVTPLYRVECSINRMLFVDDYTSKGRFVHLTICFVFLKLHFLAGFQ